MNRLSKPTGWLWLLTLGVACPDDHNLNRLVAAFPLAVVHRFFFCTPPQVFDAYVSRGVLHGLTLEKPLQFLPSAYLYISKHLANIGPRAQ